MGVRVGNDLPVEPGEASTGDLGREVLDVRVARRGVEHAARRAVVVLRVEVARAPTGHSTSVP